MAVNARDIPINREMVHGWLEEFEGQVRSTNKMRDFLQDKVTELELEDEDIFVPGNTNGETISIVDYLLQDIQTYG
jgi:hypothetical protein